MAAWEDAPLASDMPTAQRPAWEAAPVVAGQPAAAEPAAVSIGRTLMDIPRQIGLTARYGIEGLAQAAQPVTEPIRQLVVNPLARLVGAPQAAPLAEGASQLADLVGLPQPRGANERVVGDIARLMAGSAGMSSSANALANMTTGTASNVLGQLGQNQLQQLVSAAGAGGAGGTVREAGGGPAAQAVAGMAGGIAAPVATNAGANLVRSVAQRFTPVPAQQVDLQIEAAMRSNGIDWRTLPQDVQDRLRAEASQALRAGDELDPNALRRLADFARVPGATPTRGTVTLDPVLITRERNLAKSGANSTDNGLQGLARVENDNNRALINAVNAAGAENAPDSYTTGQRLIDALDRGLATERGNINQLYDAARDSAGRSFPLNGAAFTSQAATALDDALLGGALPADVRNHLNRIAQGEVPFTVDYAEQLKTRIGQLQRATSDGQTRMALGIVRRALDETPIQGLGQQTGAPGARAVNPQNLPAVPGVADLGEQAIGAFNQARAANRAMMQRVEGSPALNAVYDGSATPDQFVQKFIVGQGATARDVDALREAVGNDPAATQAVRGYIASWLKGKALNGAADEVGNFSASNYRRALDSIGERKLRTFFSPQELEQLRAIGRVGSYMTVQPRGSAVNNSNSGALLMGRGLDLLNTISGKVPLLGIGPTVQGVVRGLQQRSAQSLPPVLVTPRTAANANALRELVAPAGVYGGLLALPTVPPGQDDRRP